MNTRPSNLSQAMHGIVAVGMTTVETYLRVAEVPLPEGKHLGSMVGPFYGGMATNVVANLSLMCIDATVVTWAGPSSKEHIGPVGQYLPFLLINSDKGALPQVVVLHDPTRGTSAAILVECMRPTTLTPKQAAVIQSAGLIYYDGSWPEIVPQLLSIANKSGALLFVNCEFPRPADVSALRGCNVGVAAQGCWFPAGVPSVHDCQHAINEHWTSSHLWMGVTLGKRGSVFFDGERVEHAPAIRTRETDTTGAGDAFQAGLIHGLIHGWNLRRTLAFASRLGALQCEHVGPNLLVSDQARTTIGSIMNVDLQ